MPKMKNSYIGKEVEVIRHKHGWNDGTSGTITKVYRKYGRFTDSFIVINKDGHEFEINHIRDLRFK